MPFVKGHAPLPGAGRPAADHTGATFETLVCEREATESEIWNHLQRDVNPKERHTYWLCRCQVPECGRFYILRSDVVIGGLKKCLCQGGFRKFSGITCEIDSRKEQ